MDLGTLFTIRPGSPRCGLSYSRSPRTSAVSGSKAQSGTFSPCTGVKSPVRKAASTLATGTLREVDEHRVDRIHHTCLIDGGGGHAAEDVVRAQVERHECHSMGLQKVDGLCELAAERICADAPCDHGRRGLAGAPELRQLQSGNPQAIERIQVGRVSAIDRRGPPTGWMPIESESPKPVANLKAHEYTPAVASRAANAPSNDVSPGNLPAKARVGELAWGEEACGRWPPVRRRRRRRAACPPNSRGRAGRRPPERRVAPSRSPLRTPPGK